jgi:hypothetical protein
MNQNSSILERPKRAMERPDLSRKIRNLISLTFFAAIIGCGSFFFFSYRYRDISSTEISRLSDFDEFLAATPLGSTVKNKEFDMICFTGNYVFALGQARSFLPADEVNSRSILELAGGLGDLFNGSSHTSIVLLARQKVHILQLNRKTGFALKNVGCMAASQANIQIKSIDSITELELPRASLGVSHG